ncbi:OadG family protein [Geofilum rubicundum]|uniref:Oxaloacetate decarboxylase gamma chain n=1 Tax=Geofilum rubicundum JCM 15548 TaxID=1236989 RepID=A0A0E9M3Z2_9BACT|nr:OadG family protein [Geofilum rubicundum]GAO31890.1 oxaloacetate decarboxylase gamma chain [Geofilum rubicundum JCM 15548]
MNEYMQEAWTLLGVGMVTVFIILLVVVLIGNAIIAFVNRYFPESEIEKAATVRSFGNSRMAAITAAVNMVTRGKGRITKVERK